MKFLFLLLVGSWSLPLLAQDAPRNQIPPGLTIGKYKWEPANAGPSVDSSIKAESDSPSGDSSGTSSQDSQIGERPTFVYWVEVTNGGSKAIKAIRWDYIITDSKTGEELGRHEFESLEKIGRDKTKRLNARSRMSPTRIVPIQVSEKGPTAERVTLKCIVYEDGSLWQQAGTPSQLCEGIRRRATN
ncbi:MAG TPA: hypothetical protein VNG71_15960 [Pyrinomonadaceae bacterium]|nr:hypothetical protein [Pyrinomonadaceae bacterium]